MTVSDVAMWRQMRPSFRFTSSSSSSMVSSLLRCSRDTLPISSSTTLNSSLMLPSVRMSERILATTSSSKRRALSVGVLQASLPSLMFYWQT